VLNPAHLHKPTSGIEAADMDLLRGGMIAIIAPPRTPPEAVDLASDLARLVGAKAYFADPFEMDGLMASTHILPQLLAAALLNATLEQSGWSEARKIAGRSFTEVTSPILHPTPAGALSAAALLNQKNIIRILDDVIASINAIRAEIADGDSNALDQHLADLRRGREEWWQQRLSSQWSGEGAPTAELPTSGDMLGRMIGLGRKRGKEKW
jgi:prephenate dehydrogenase